MKHKEKEQPQRLSIPEVSADPAQGLSREAVARRIEGGWANRTPEAAGASEKDIILRNVFTFFNLIFVIMAVILAISGSSVKNMTFLIVVVCNCVIGCFQEIRAKRAVDKLTLVAAQTVRAVRDGETVPVRSDELVRDDIVEFTAGSQICADAVLRSGTMQVNEALITGEADAITKKPGDLLHSGSFVVAGTGRAQLTRVGEDAFAARLAAEAKANPRAAKSEMMRSLDRLIQVVGFALIPVGGLLFWQEYKVLQMGFRGSVESTVAALVGMIPEGLYLLTSIAVAASTLKLTRQRVLVQDMNCIETLARVDVLCVDKTGTITEPKMEVENVVPLTEQPPEYLEQALGSFYAGQEPENDTARAMSEMFVPPASPWTCTGRIPFTSESKWSGAVFEEQGAFLVGAPEFILGERYAEVADAVTPWLENGYRVLLVARYDGDPKPGALEPEKLTPLALAVLLNRIRSSAPETFAYFAQQGVSVRVISGDNPAAVAEIARKAGIAGAEHYIDAGQLETDEDFRKAAAECTVFGRVTPDKKKKLIETLKAQGHTVAMTGDGVNDVLAMKASDCGIAMASGAQAASQVARIVLLDSDFSVMPSIVGEGRRVINNIQRAATLFLVKNIYSLFLSIITLFTNWPYPMQPVHMSMISSLTIGLPSLFLAMEPNYERVKGHFLRSVLRKAFPGGLTNIFVVLAAQAYMVVFDLPLNQISTVCTAILCAVGLLVLYQVSQPFDRFRRIIWGLVAAALVGCFLFLNGFLELYSGDLGVKLVLATLLIMTPTVFFAIRRVFDWGDKAYQFFCRKFRKKEPEC